jgi:hypothetical protein
VCARFCGVLFQKYLKVLQEPFHPDGPVLHVSCTNQASTLAPATPRMYLLPPPLQVVRLLNELYMEWDELCEATGVYKVSNGSQAWGEGGGSALAPARQQGASIADFDGHAGPNTDRPAAAHFDHATFHTHPCPSI